MINLPGIWTRIDFLYNRRGKDIVFPRQKGTQRLARQPSVTELPQCLQGRGIIALTARRTDGRRDITSAPAEPVLNLFKCSRRERLLGIALVPNAQKRFQHRLRFRHFAFPQRRQQIRGQHQPAGEKVFAACQRRPPAHKVRNRSVHKRLRKAVAFLLC